LLPNPAIETDGFTDENDDGVIATLDDNERVLTTTFTSSARVTSPVARSGRDIFFRFHRRSGRIGGYD
jgi:hypothetical protein